MAEDIAQWRYGLGRGQYAQAFEDNGMDIEALPRLKRRGYLTAILTEQDSFLTLPKIRV